jgi:hypothetical protein
MEPAAAEARSTAEPMTLGRSPIRPRRRQKQRHSSGNKKPFHIASLLLNSKHILCEV